MEDGVAFGVMLCISLPGSVDSAVCSIERGYPQLKASHPVSAS